MSLSCCVGDYKNKTSVYIECLSSVVLVSIRTEHLSTLNVTVPLCWVGVYKNKTSVYIECLSSVVLVTIRTLETWRACESTRPCDILFQTAVNKYMIVHQFLISHVLFIETRSDPLTLWQFQFCSVHPALNFHLSLIYPLSN